MAVIIKGRLLTPEEPIICVPVLEPDYDGIIAEASRLADLGVEMIEWRIDHFLEYDNSGAVREVLEELKNKTKNVILLATLRSKEQGGLAKVTSFEKSIIYDEIAQSHCADIIDVEAGSFPDAYDLIKKLQKRGAIVLASEHDHTGTPSDEKLTELFATLAKLDPDIVKLAVMPENESDTDRLIAAAKRFHEANDRLPMIAVSMGSKGQKSRIECRAIGSCVTFAAGRVESAPGQPSLEDMRRALA